MLIADWSSTTNTGRVRRNNEDSYLAAPPLFAIADGMGGAQAGEVASRICVEALAELQPLPGEAAEDRLRRAIEEANRRIVERSAGDAAVAGMGSTVTAALLDDDRVAFGHVGDSRAYLLRAGRLQQLSHDHSLVAELLRQGRLTAEEAENHPQRAIITRALGQAPDVEVDTWSVEAADGDIYLLCSDGLSGLVADDRLAELLAAATPLEQAVRALVRAANEAGGDDNITSVAFRVAADGGDAATIVAAGAVAAEPPSSLDEDTLTEADDVPLVRAPLLAERPPAPAIPLEEPPRGRGGMIAAIVAAIVGLVALAVIAGSWVALRWAHFVGVDPATGRVAVYAGLPVELGGGHTLYRIVYRSPIAAASLPQAERSKLLDHELRSRSDAVAAVEQLQRTEP